MDFENSHTKNFRSQAKNPDEIQKIQLRDNARKHIVATISTKIHNYYVKYGKIPELEKKIAAVTAELEKKAGQQGQLLREEVCEEDIARIVSMWTGIPVSKMLASEMQKFLQLEKPEWPDVFYAIHFQRFDPPIP